MFSFWPRTAALAGVVSSLALIGSVAPAQAIVPTSNITTPTDPAYLFQNNSPSATFTVAGTANVLEVDIRCYYGPASSETLLEKVTVSGGVFSATVPLSELSSQQPCVLRAVPTGDKEAHPPEQGAPFTGPRVIKSVFGLSEESGVTYDYNFEPDTLSAYLGIEAMGDEALYYSFLFAPGTLEKSVNGFYDNGSLTGENLPASGSATRSELQIDGTDAYSPYSARILGRKLTEEPVKKTPGHVLPGTPSVVVEQSYEPATGEGVIHESDPIVECAPEPNVYPATVTSCTSFVSTGVQLNRTWQATHADHVALMSDAWTSTDGKSHALDALYDQEVGSKTIEGAFQFPGTSAFAPVSKGQSVSLPSGSGAIYFKVNQATPEGGDLHNPQLAIVYDSVASGPLTFYAGSNGKERPGFEMHYARTIPAGGSYKLRMGFVTEYALGAVRTLAGEVLAGYSPSVSIASPANGTAVSTPTVTVSGSASDTGALASVAVNGHAAALASNGSWSVSVPLNPGANTLSAVATDQAGLTASQAIGVTYVPTQAVQIGKASGANGKVSFKIACKGLAGQKCKVVATLTTKEKLRGSTLLAISAKHRKRPKTRTKVVTVGARTVTIPAGKTVTVTIAPNATGRKLLARFHKLPVHLSAVLVVGAVKSTVIAQNLTIRPPKKRHKGRH